MFLIYMLIYSVLQLYVPKLYIDCIAFKDLLKPVFQTCFFCTKYAEWIPFLNFFKISYNS
jgi:hypothetical protein